VVDSRSRRRSAGSASQIRSCNLPSRSGVRQRANMVKQLAEVDALSSFDGFYAECRGEIAVNYYRTLPIPLF